MWLGTNHRLIVMSEILPSSQAGSVISTKTAKRSFANGVGSPHLRERCENLILSRQLGMTRSYSEPVLSSFEPSYLVTTACETEFILRASVEWH